MPEKFKRYKWGCLCKNFGISAHWLVDHRPNSTITYRWQWVPFHANQTTTTTASANYVQRHFQSSRNQINHTGLNILTFSAAVMQITSSRNAFWKMRTPQYPTVQFTLLLIYQSKTIFPGSEKRACSSRSYWIFFNKLHWWEHPARFSQGVLVLVTRQIYSL